MEEYDVESVADCPYFQRRITKDEIKEAVNYRGWARR